MTERGDFATGDPTHRGTVLIADKPEAIATLKRTLDGHEVAWLIATTFDEARELLRPGIDLILCGIHFDDQRMFDFLKLAKETPATAAVPFVCVRMLGMLAKPLGPLGIEVASRELGAAAYVDHVHLQNTHGTGAADRELRNTLIEACRS